MVDPDDEHDAVGLDNLVEHAIVTSTGTVQAHQRIAEWLAESVRVRGQQDRRELDDRGGIPWRDLGEVSPRARTQPNRKAV